MIINRTYRFSSSRRTGSGGSGLLEIEAKGSPAPTNKATTNCANNAERHGLVEGMLVAKKALTSGWVQGIVFLKLTAIRRSRRTEVAKPPITIRAKAKAISPTLSPIRPVEE